MSNNASSTFASETQMAPSYALQHQSVVGYTPSGIIGTEAAPADKSSGINLHTLPGQSVGDPTLRLQLPFRSRVTQVVVEAVFPNDPQGMAETDRFNIGLGELNGPPTVSVQPENLNFFFENVTGKALANRVMKDAGFLNPVTAQEGGVGYVSKFPALESNYVSLGNGDEDPEPSNGNLQSAYMRGAEFKVVISYVVIADTAASNLQLAINQARPSVRGA